MKGWVHLSRYLNTSSKNKLHPVWTFAQNFQPCSQATTIRSPRGSIHFIKHPQNDFREDVFLDHFIPDNLGTSKVQVWQFGTSIWRHRLGFGNDILISAPCNLWSTYFLLQNCIDKPWFPLSCIVECAIRVGHSRASWWVATDINWLIISWRLDDSSVSVAQLAGKTSTARK